MPHNLHFYKFPGDAKVSGPGPHPLNLCLGPSLGWGWGTSPCPPGPGGLPSACSWCCQKAGTRANPAHLVNTEPRSSRSSRNGFHSEPVGQKKKPHHGEATPSGVSSTVCVNPEKTARDYCIPKKERGSVPQPGSVSSPSSPLPLP